MKPSSLRRLALAAAALAPLAAFAHPGHDGGHDLEWDTGHFAAHPLATLLCLTLLATGLWAVAQLIRSRRAKDELVMQKVKTRR